MTRQTCIGHASKMLSLHRLTYAHAWYCTQITDYTKRPLFASAGDAFALFISIHLLGTNAMQLKSQSIYNLGN